jgi:hypothetical protein
MTAVLLLLLLPIIIFGYIRLMKDDMHWTKQIGWTLLMTAYVLFWAWFLLEYSDANDHWRKIDTSVFYSPISARHSLTFWVFHLLSVVGLLNLWNKGRKQAPLILVFSSMFVLFGVILQGVIIVQLAHPWDYISRVHQMGLLLGPIIHIVISILLLFSFLKNEIKLANERSFKHSGLQFLNEKIKESEHFMLWVLILFLPVLIVITLVLVLFGQEYDSLAKVFTETTTWSFSQKTHPPYIEHQGHYLCTVAACGSPRIVKPLRLGKRAGQDIIVNRQLMVANAFEALIQDRFPRAHRFIRRNYDTYGYPLSKDITTPFKSNVTYVLMKPLEWFFLLCVYSFCEKPEQLIHAQYKC